MDCPLCKASATRTIYTRHDDDGHTLRWKKCLACEYKWFTVEWAVPREAVSHYRNNKGMSSLRLNPGYTEIYFDGE